jgi:hypothetical protein
MSAIRARGLAVAVAVGALFLAPSLAGAAEITVTVLPNAQGGVNVAAEGLKPGDKYEVKATVPMAVAGRCNHVVIGSGTVPANGKINVQGPAGAGAPIIIGINPQPNGTYEDAWRGIEKTGGPQKVKSDKDKLGQLGANRLDHLGGTTLGTSAGFFFESGGRYSQLTLVNSDPNQCYAFTDLRVYQNIPKSHFTAADFDSASAIAEGELVRDLDNEVIAQTETDPATSFPEYTLALGPVQSGRYVLVVGTIDLAPSSVVSDPQALTVVPFSMAFADPAPVPAMPWPVAMAVAVMLAAVGWVLLRRLTPAA